MSNKQGPARPRLSPLSSVEKSERLTALREKGRSAAPVVKTGSDAVKITVGEVMDDGAIYVGVSPDTKKAMYVLPADEDSLMTFSEAAYRATIRSLQTRDKNYRVPSALLRSRAGIGLPPNMRQSLQRHGVLVLTCRLHILRI